MRGSPSARGRPALVVGWVLLLSVGLLWPLHTPGYLLGHDLVITPDQPLDLGSIGVSSASPRAVPLDALVALAGQILTGPVVGRLALLLPLVAAGVGAARLLERATLPGQLVAAGFAVWNPYVVERMAIGQWALLWAYAALPWLALVCRARPSRAVWARRLLVVAAASITPTGGLIALVAAPGLTFAARRAWRESLVMLSGALALQLAWIVPAVVSNASGTSDPAAVAVFAARAEHPGGALTTLFGLGGIWNTDVVPSSRGGAPAWIGLVVLVLAWVVGGRRLSALVGRSTVRGLVGLAVLGLVLAGLSAVPGGAGLLRELVSTVPGAGLLRDGQKWVAPLALVQALVLGAALDRIVVRLGTRPWRVVAAVAALCLPLLLLPDGASTVHPTITAVHYPRDWKEVDRIVRGSTVAVVPFQSYRLFPWAPGRSVLDPAPRLLHARVIVQDRLAVGGRLLGGEDPRAAEVARALQAGSQLPDRLAAAGVDYVVLERDTPGSVPSLDALVPVYDGPSLRVYRVPGPVRTVSPRTAHVVAVLTADAVAALIVLWALSIVVVDLAARARIRRRRVLPSSNPSY